MNYRTTLLPLAFLTLLSACGQSNDQPAPKLFKEQRDALDKAKAVDPALQQQNEEQRKTIDQQTQ
jgi:hypothetical protein